MSTSSPTVRAAPTLQKHDRARKSTRDRAIIEKVPAIQPAFGASAFSHSAFRSSMILAGFCGSMP